MNINKGYKFMLVLQLVLLLQVFIQIPLILLGVEDILIFSILHSTIIFGIPIMYFLIFKSNYTIKDTLNLNKISRSHITFSIICTVLFIPLGGFLSLVTSLFFNNNIADYLMHIATVPSWKLLIILAILPAFFEELIMRGVFLSNFKGLPIHIVAFINGLFFCIMHQDLQQSMYTFIFGVYLTYLVYYTGSIIAPMIAHFVFNSNSVISLALYKNYYGDDFLTELSKEEVITKEILLSQGLVALLCISIGLLLFYFNIVKKPNLLYEENNDENIVEKQPMFNKLFFANIIFYVFTILFNFYLY